MLLCQHCCRRQHRHLFAVKHSLKGSTQSHLSFSVTYITAEQTLHRLRLFHISLDFGNRLQLVRCFLIRKGCFKVLLQLTVRRKSMSGHNLPLCIQTQQLLRQLRNRLSRLSRSAFPVIAAHFRQTRHTALAADIFMQHTDLLYRNIELIIAGIGQKQIITVDAVNLDVFYPYITADAMHLMNNIISGLDIRKILQLLALVFSMQALALLHAENIIFCQQQPFFIPEAKAVIQIAVGYIDDSRLKALLGKMSL